MHVGVKEALDQDEAKCNGASELLVIRGREERERRAGGDMATGSLAQPSSRACSAVLSLVTPCQAAANSGQADVIGPSGRCLGLEVIMINRKKRRCVIVRRLACVEAHHVCHRCISDCLG
jgi:hypothetical protein